MNCAFEDSIVSLALRSGLNVSSIELPVVGHEHPDEPGVDKLPFVLHSQLCILDQRKYVMSLFKKLVT